MLVNVISHDPNFAQSKLCMIQILLNPNFAQSKFGMIQTLHNPNFARFKFCTIQMLLSQYFFSILPSHFLVCCFFYTFCWFLHPGKAWQCCFTVWNILIQALWESSWCFQWSKATSVLAPTHYSTGPVEREGWWVLGGGVKAGAWKDEEGLSAAFTGLVGMRRHCGGGGWWRYHRHC